MTDLSPKARALLARTSQGFEPRPADRERVRAAIHARVGAAAAAGAALSLPAAAMRGHSVRGLLTKVGLGAPLAKLLASFGVLAVVALALVLRRERPVQDEPRASPVASMSPPLAPVPLPSSIDDEPRVPVVDVASLPSARPKAPLVSPSTVNVEAGSIEDEIALLREAQGAARALDDVHALGLLDAHARRFPSGVLAEERDAARIFALCHLGRGDEARKARAAFLAAHPDSPHIARVREACPAE